MQKVLFHVINETRNPLYKTRRPTLQPLLAFDVFLNCIKKQKPDYVTFFSNHVAGIMHRYWRYAFPEDFEEPLASTAQSEFHKDSLITAMDIFDDHLSKLLNFAQIHNYAIVVASSMGQEAIDRGKYIPELGLNDFEKLMGALEFGGHVKLNLAMQPDLSFEVTDTNTLARFAEALNSVTDIEGEKLIPTRYEPVGLTVNRKLVSTASLIENKKILIGGRALSLSDAGFHLFERDEGTGYHQPEGVLIWQTSVRKPDNQRRVIDSKQFLPTVLSNFKINLEEYMLPPISIC
ncbi:MAG: hypothetical protein AB8D52_11505 [Gammaproteobacteria bacterium]